MELFVVDRYVEQDEEPKNEDLILKRLQKKIEKRKQSRSKIKKVQFASPIKETLPEEYEVKETEQTDDISNTKETFTNGDVDENKQIVEEPQHDEATTDIPQTEEKQVTSDSFTVLGKDNFKKQIKVKRVLPYWLSNPTVMSSDLKDEACSIDSIVHLNDTLKNNLKSAGIKHLFPVQATLVPWLLRGLNLPEPLRQEDVCVSAPTGSGKTLAFVLPIVQALQSRVVRRVRALVVLPVHELAIQVTRVFHKMCLGTDLKVTLLAAQSSLHIEQSVLVKKSNSGEYISNVDIVVCTAGRLVEHLHSTPGFSLKHLKYLVLDEADKTMESTQNDWLQHVEKHIKNETNQESTSTKLSLSSLRVFNWRPQKLLFSATLSQDPEKLQRLGLFQPKLFTTVARELNEQTDNNELVKRGDFIGRYTTPAELQEFYCVSTSHIKPLILLLLIKREGWKQVLCFANSSKNAHRLSLLLSHMAKDMKVSELSAALDFKTREKTLEAFDKGDINILIATDALARGMDIEIVDVVLSYDSPKFVRNYIHRIGRTGRAGRPGKAVTLLLKEHLTQFKQILKTGGKDTIPEMKVTQEEIDEQMDLYKEALDNLKESIQKEEKDEIVNTKIEKQGRAKRKTEEGKNKKSKRRKTTQNEETTT